MALPRKTKLETVKPRPSKTKIVEPVKRKATLPASKKLLLESVRPMAEALAKHVAKKLSKAKQAEGEVEITNLILNTKDFFQWAKVPKAGNSFPFTYNGKTYPFVSSEPKKPKGRS